MMKRVILVAILSLSAAFTLHAGQLEIIESGPRGYVSLAGQWEVLPIKGLSFTYPPPADGWKKEVVPHENGRTRTIKTGPYATGTQIPLKTGKLVRDDQMAAWFRHSFTLPAVLPAGNRIVLHFEGIAFRSETWLNGRKIGTSVQCAVPVEYDVTEALVPGKNTLTVGITGAEGILDLENKTLITPAWGMMAGIRHEVSLRFLPTTFVDDIFIKTSVKNKRLDADVTIINRSSKPVTTTPTLSVRDRNQIPQFTLASDALTLKPGESRVVTLTKNWIATNLWSIGNGALYNATVKLTQGAITIDSKNQSFGFREFEVRGRDFYLNGVKTVLIRNSLLTAMGTKPAGKPLVPDVRGNPNMPYNCYRLHLGQNNKYVLDETDKSGLMMIPESSWNQVRCYPLAKKDLWLPNTLEFYRRWIRTNRNRPSVIIWSLANETFWGNMPETPAMRPIAEAIVKTVRKADPTRPLDGDAEVSWDGLLDIISIHYPGLPGPLSQKYSNSGFIVPNDLYWLKDKNNHSWRATFDWDKPLSLGEFWHIDGSPDRWATCGGEETYNWVRYSMEDRIGKSAASNSDFTALLQKACDAYRIQGVACLNPWSGNADKTMPRIAVRPLDFHPNFRGGETAERRVVIFYESGFKLNYSRLHCFMTIRGKKVWENTVDAPVKSGEPKLMALPITPPAVLRQEEAELTVRHIYHAGGKFHEKSRYKETIFIMPQVSLQDVPATTTVVLDPSGGVATALKVLGLNTTSVKALTPTTLTGKRVLLIAGDAAIKTDKDTILDFAKRGGRVLFLQRESWEYISSSFPEQDRKHVTTRSWKRSFHHPVVADLDDRQLSYWRPDNLVGKLNFLKPYSGDTRVILDAAGTRGLEWTPLCETSFGKGLLVFSQLSLTDRLTVEPAAAQMTANLIRYALNYTPPATATLRVLAKNNPALQDILKTCRIATSQGLKGIGPILLDADYPLTEADLNTIKDFVKKGGKLWLHNLTGKNTGKVASLLPFTPVLSPINPNITAAVRVSDSPLMHNLSTRDFFWTRARVGVRGEYLDGSTPTAKLGDVELTLPTLHSGTRLLEPALLSEIKNGKGTILVDTLQWEKAFETEGDYVIRIISALAANLGSSIVKAQENQMDTFPVDLAPFANMGYVDEIEQDGKGGWLDMGTADLCFFLINHTGLGGGTGMPVAVPPFPEQNRFCGIPFTLTAPKKNNGKGMIALRSTDRALKLPADMKGIPVGQKADTLHFIHSANYVPAKRGVTLATYVIHYDDGTSADFNVRSWLEVGDWCMPKKIPNARICWTGRNRVISMVGLYLAPWTNPHPEKTIKSIDLIGAKTKAQIGLIGISGARKKALEDGTPVAAWRFGTFNGRTVKAENGNLPLSFQRRSKTAPAPTLGELGGQPTLVMNGEQYFSGNLKKVEVFDPTRPFAITATFSISDLPKNHTQLFGICQAMVYNQSGYRFMVKQDGRISLSVFTGPGQAKHFSGKTQLTLNRPYTAKVAFGKNQVKLFLNGKLETTGKCPMPAPFKGEILIGHASGQGTLNGTLQQVTIIQ